MSHSTLNSSGVLKVNSSSTGFRLRRGRWQMPLLLYAPHPLPEFAQVHVHFIGGAAQSSHPSKPSSPSAPNHSTFLSHLFTSDDQNTGALASASVLLVNIQGLSPLRLTGFFSLPSKGLSGAFSSTTVQRHQFFGILPSLRSSSYSRVRPLGRPQP